MTCTQTVVSFHNMKGESYSSYALQKAEVWMQGWNLHGQDIVYQKFCSIYLLARATKPPLAPPRSNFCSAATAFLPHYGILIHIVCLTFTMHAWLLTLHIYLTQIRPCPSVILVLARMYAHTSSIDNT